jgi:hypothetical protein
MCVCRILFFYYPDLADFFVWCSQHFAFIWRLKESGTKSMWRFLLIQLTCSCEIYIKSTKVIQSTHKRADIRRMWKIIIKAGKRRFFSSLSHAMFRLVSISFDLISFVCFLLVWLCLYLSHVVNILFAQSSWSSSSSSLDHSLKSPHLSLDIIFIFKFCVWS